MTTLAWHFLSDTGELRGGSAPPPDGEWLEHSGECVMCESGLHASERIIDALQYAPGAILCRVECDDVDSRKGDKLVCRRRKILWRMDASGVLRAFARRCALDVIDKWDAPAIVREYLETGDESKRAAAWDAARDVAWDAAWDVAWDAARAAARDVARGAARDAAWDVAWDKYGTWLEKMVMEAHERALRGDRS